MMKNTLGIIVAGLCLSVSAFAIERTNNSPDGKMVVTVSDEGGKPSYCVSYNGVEFIKEIEYAHICPFKEEAEFLVGYLEKRIGEVGFVLKA
jgi:hypothetical protein